MTDQKSPFSQLPGPPSPLPDIERIRDVAIAIRANMADQTLPGRTTAGRAVPVLEVDFERIPPETSALDIARAFALAARRFGVRPLVVDVWGLPAEIVVRCRWSPSRWRRPEWLSDEPPSAGYSDASRSLEHAGSSAFYEGGAVTVACSFHEREAVSAVA